MKSKIAAAIEQYKKRQEELHQQHLDERSQYLEFCSKEAERIIPILTNACLDDLTSSGIAYVSAIGTIDNIFQTRISGLVADAMRSEGLELTLFRSIGIVKVSIDENGIKLPE